MIVLVITEAGTTRDVYILLDSSPGPFTIMATKGQGVGLYRFGGTGAVHRSQYFSPINLEAAHALHLGYPLRLEIFPSPACLRCKLGERMFLQALN